jgi:two-component system sensor histidine kinase YesM
MNKLTHIFNKQKIYTKIWLGSILSVIVVIVIIDVSSLFFFTKLYKTNTYEMAKDIQNLITKNLTQETNNILFQIVKFTSNPQIFETKGNNSYTNNFNKIQNDIFNLKNSSSLINNVLIIDSNNNIYNDITYGKNTKKIREIFSWDLSNISEITWLSIRHSPLQNNKNIIPIIVPIDDSEFYSKISNNENQTSYKIVILLDTDILNNMLNANLFNTESINLLLNKDNICINNISNSNQYLDNGNAINEKYLYYKQELSFSNLSLYSLLSKEELFSGQKEIYKFIIFSTIVGLVVTLVLTQLIAINITMPFKRLMNIIKLIQENKYFSNEKFIFNNETSLLGKELNTMHSTIQDQMTLISKKERDNYNLEIQILTEQINPHFIYNTLEFINIQIISNHNESACKMIQNLASFLRNGLNHGNRFISISNELEHVLSYINIIKTRKSFNLVLNINVPHELLDIKIQKLILQPLVENSIVHGFNNTVNTLPTIDISMHEIEGTLIIDVSDNGSGIDVEKARKAINDSKSNSIGLYNIYQRLFITYGNVTIDFSSIPYFKNTVTIKIKDYKNIGEKYENRNESSMGF